MPFGFACLFLSLALLALSETNRLTVAQVINENRHTVRRIDDRNTDSSTSSPGHVRSARLRRSLEETRPLTDVDFANADIMTDEPGTTSPRIETDGKFEGDIDLNGISPAYFGNNGMDNEIVGHKWDYGQVPYVISTYFNHYERHRIASAILAFQRKTNCVRLVPWNGYESDYIYFTKGKGCSSPVGRQGGRQYVSIGPGCARSSTVQHEIVHALGFWHEQSRTDRDEYVIIHYGNIAEDMKYNFGTYGRIPLQPNGRKFDYDYGSIMHYGSTAFSKNGKITIESRNGARIGQRKGLSQLDIDKINARYNSCYGGPHPPPPPPPPPPQTTRPPPATTTKQVYRPPQCRRCRRCNRFCRRRCGWVC